MVAFATQQDATRDFYYSPQWQCIEERITDVSTSTTMLDRQYIWGLRYVDDLVRRDRDTTGNGTLDETLYALNDRQFNVIALWDPDAGTSGEVVERFCYTPYGGVQFLNEDFTTKSGTGYAWTNLFQGLPRDPATLLYHNRARELHPLLGRFLQRDPLGYPDGLNAYAAYHVMWGTVDPTGRNSFEDAAPDFSPVYHTHEGRAYLIGIVGVDDIPEFDDSSNLAIDALIAALELGCFFQCYVLGFTSDDAREFLDDLKNDMSAAERTAMDAFIQQAATRPPEALLAFLKAWRTRFKITQGTGMIGGSLKFFLGDRLNKKLRTTMAQRSVRIVGRSGVKVFGRIGSKLIPGFGYALFGYEACKIANCVAACSDGEYTRDESLLARIAARDRRGNYQVTGTKCYDCHPNVDPVIDPDQFDAMNEFFNAE